jgi:sulfate permease, SulP family
MKLVVGDLYGGVAGAVVGLAQILTLGLLAFGALGPHYVPLSVEAAFNAAIFGALAAALVGGTAIPAAGPRAATALIFATYVAALAARPEFRGENGLLQVGPILLLASLSVILAGALQIVFGFARIGSLVRFVPYPVVAGFMNGIAVLLALAQIPYLLGVDAAQFAREGFDTAQARPGAIAVALFTATLIWIFGRHLRRVPVALLALMVGAVMHQLVATFWPLEVGGVLGAAQSSLHLSNMYDAWQAHYVELESLLRTHGLALFATAGLIAVIGALDSLLAAAAVDMIQDTRHQPNRLLAGEGLGNIVSGALGGIPIQFSAARSLAAFRAGARTQLSGFVTPLTLFLLLLIGGPLLVFVPLAALAGIMLTVSTAMIDRWSSGLVRHLVRVHSADASGTLWVVVLVCAATVGFGFLPAVAIGMALATVLFIRAMNRSLVRAVWNGAQRSSRRIYPPDDALRLLEEGRRIKILELDGPLFFGTAERLGDYVETHVEGVDFLILDLRRVAEADATGALVLQRLNKRLKERGCRLLLAHVTPTGQIGQSLDVFGTFKGEERSQWFEDTDRALEAAERALLGREPGKYLVAPFPLHECVLFEGLGDRRAQIVIAHLERKQLRAGEVLFREGDPGDRLFLLTAGTVTLVSAAGRGTHRIASFESGVMFGELAMIDGLPRSATAMAEQDAELYALSRDALERLNQIDPQLPLKLLENLAHHLSQRLRQTTDQMRIVADSGD